MTDTYDDRFIERFLLLLCFPSLWGLTLASLERSSPSKLEEGDLAKGDFSLLKRPADYLL